MGTTKSAPSIVLKHSVAEQMMERDKSLQRIVTNASQYTSRFDSDGNLTGGHLTCPETPREERNGLRKETRPAGRSCKPKTGVVKIDAQHSRGKIGLKLLNYQRSQAFTHAVTSGEMSPSASSITQTQSPRSPISTRTPITPRSPMTPRSPITPRSPFRSHSPLSPRSDLGPMFASCASQLQHSPLSLSPRSPIVSRSPTTTSTLLRPRRVSILQDPSPEINDLFLHIPTKCELRSATNVKRIKLRRKPAPETVTEQSMTASEHTSEGLVRLLQDAVGSVATVEPSVTKRFGVRKIAAKEPEEKSTIAAEVRLSALAQFLRKEDSVGPGYIRKKLTKRNSILRRLSGLSTIEKEEGRAEKKWKWIGRISSLEDSSN